MIILNEDSIFNLAIEVHFESEKLIIKATVTAKGTSMEPTKSVCSFLGLSRTPGGSPLVNVLLRDVLHHFRQWCRNAGQKLLCGKR